MIKGGRRLQERKENGAGIRYRQNKKKNQNTKQSHMSEIKENKNKGYRIFTNC